MLNNMTEFQDYNLKTLIIYTLACSVNSQKWLTFRFCLVDQYANYMYALEKNVLKETQFKLSFTCRFKRSSMEYKMIYY